MKKHGKMGELEMKSSQYAPFIAVTNIIVILRKLTKASRAFGTVEMTSQEKAEARASAWAALPGVVCPSPRTSPLLCWPSHKVLKLHFSCCFRTWTWRVCIIPIYLTQCNNIALLFLTIPETSCYVLPLLISFIAV